MTSYQVIFEKFIKKLKGDTHFFNYKDIPTSEIEAIVEEHLLSLLERAINKIYELGLPDINFYNKDDLTQNFNEELTPQEINLLSDLMYLAYLEEDRNKLKVIQTTFRSNELNVLSPANERNSYLNMLEGIESNIINSVINYLSRDRKTWEFKSLYGGL